MDLAEVTPSGWINLVTAVKGVPLLPMEPSKPAGVPADKRKNEASTPPTYIY
jgi:hypothetical protein